MVLTKDELIASLQNEVRILLHLAGKIDRNKLDYRPTPKQRSTIELLRYLTIMGPMLLRAIKAGGFDPAAWEAADNAAGPVTATATPFRKSRRVMSWCMPSSRSLADTSAPYCAMARSVMVRPRSMMSNASASSSLTTAPRMKSSIWTTCACAKPTALS